MSYFDESNTTTSLGSYPDTFLLYDIYALHQLYGANTAFHSGDSTYGFNSNLGGAYDFTTNTDPLLCIWDGSGTDTLDLTGYTQDQRITLQQGEFSDVAGYQGNLSIAIGAVIEQALGGSGSDDITGNDAGNFLHGYAGHDTLVAGEGNDTLAGGTGADTLYGNYGADVLAGGNDGDQLFGGSGYDTLFGNNGDDTLYGNFGSDVLSGGADNDLLYGGTGHDNLRGGAGNDTLYGNTGFDRLEGGSGDDLLRGGTYEDRFVFDTGHGNDEISDFTVGIDRLQLSSALVGGLTSAAEVLDTYATDLGDMVRFQFSSGEIITLSNVASLTGLEGDIDIF